MPGLLSFIVEKTSATCHLILGNVMNVSFHSFNNEKPLIISERVKNINKIAFSTGYRGMKKTVFSLMRLCLLGILGYSRAFYDLIVERTSEMESETLHFRESEDNKRFNTAY
jgi:hypothetical protein